MLRVRDELKMTLMAYQTLYESSIAFGIRKALRAEQGKAEMESYIQKLEAEKTKLDKEVKKNSQNHTQTHIRVYSFMIANACYFYTNSR